MEAIWVRADYECELCRRTMGLQEHHIVYRGQGGSDRKENIILLCWYCHHGDNGVHGKNGSKLDRQLKIGLQKHYEWLGESNIKQLMGGRYYEGEVYLPFVINHFKKMKELRGNR